jgi:hypothetical protein
VLQNLTANGAGEINATITEAIAKYKAQTNLGTEAPKDILVW